VKWVLGRLGRLGRLWRRIHPPRMSEEYLEAYERADAERIIAAHKASQAQQAEPAEKEQS
jgi:hypothetical protein